MAMKIFVLLAVLAFVSGNQNNEKFIEQLTGSDPFNFIGNSPLGNIKPGSFPLGKPPSIFPGFGSQNQKPNQYKRQTSPYTIPGMSELIDKFQEFTGNFPVKFPRPDIFGQTSSSSSSSGQSEGNSES